MNPESNPATSMNPDLVLTRVFDAPRALVFEAWTDPILLSHWWGPHGFTNPRCELDVRPRGKIHVDMRGPDGTIYPMPGEYREVVEPERIVFTAGALNAKGKLMFEILNTVTFTEVDGKTSVTLRAHVLNTTVEAAQHLEGQEMGWSQSLERFATLLGDIQSSGGDAQPDTSARGYRISRVLNAPRDLVWQAMSSPEHVTHWWGPRGFTTTTKEMDLRPGGRWIHTMHGPDGTDYPNESLFLEVVKPERIVYSHGGRGREGSAAVRFISTWTFEALDACRTRVTIRALFTSSETRDTVVKEYGAIEGGKQTLQRLGEHVSGEPLVVERSFNAPVEVVWRALTEKKQMTEWFFDVDDFKPEPGFVFRFDGPGEYSKYHHQCTVMEVAPCERLAFTWRYEGYEGDSLVTIELIGEGNKTRLKLTHEGLDSFANAQPFSRENFTEGWNHIIGKSLPEFIESHVKAAGAA